ncbi:MAG: PQQ-dependent dehydrogenase, methanol/ethanol family, partial [Cyclobacteriaceae bacterium]|nr:PQQ-dependent dehydrogenase, methanol/ethanol family [Cyclobacteriaceae bacterium]
KNLAVDWFMDLPTDKALVSTPLVVDGILYFTGTMNRIRAVDATNGTLLWEFDPEVAKHIGKNKKPGWTQSRGISYYNGKIFTATWEGRLIALDAKSGKQIWSALTIAPDKKMNITGAPKAFAGKVIIGNGGSEAAPNRGYVTAYDAETGKQAWRFYIVPGNPADGFEDEAMEMAAKTWTGEWWKYGGGGNAWHGLTYDAELNTIYIGTGNGGPWNPKVRSENGGDNLFLSSIVALDPETGAYKWHYQTTPGDSWDFNSSMDIVLATIKIKGKDTKVIMHAPKNGFFYVINRETGKLISAKPFVETSWASSVDSITGKPNINPNARYENGKVYITPSPHGAHSWHAMSYNPMTGLVYIPTIHDATIFDASEINIDDWKNNPDKGGIAVSTSDPDSLPRPYTGSLQAWDPITQKQAWIVPHKELWNAGTLTTAGGLVFQGLADGKFNAYDAKSGKLIWSYDAGLGISAPPITYKIMGKQYIALLVGWGGAFAGVGNKNLGWDYNRHNRRLLVFSLEGKAIVPVQPPPYFPKPIVDANFEIDENLVVKGEDLYWQCFNCHGANVIAKGMAPDLRASPIATSQDA